MSRLSKEYLWSYWFGKNIINAICPCCKETTINYCNTNWQAGHIIPHRSLGPDIYQNIRPICLNCNINDKYFQTNYHYMISIGTMQQDDLLPALAKIHSFAKEHIENPSKFRCNANYQKRRQSMRCSNKKIPRSNYCGIHQSHNVTRPLYQYEITLFNLHKKVKYALSRTDIFDENELANFKEFLIEIREDWKLAQETYGPLQGQKVM